MISYEATLFALTLLRAWILHREGANTPIITLLTRDGAWYFLVALGSVSMMAVWTTIPRMRAAAFYSQLHMAIVSSACCRLLLRLRGFYLPATIKSTGREGAMRDEDMAMHPIPRGGSEQIHDLRRSNQTLP
ncbi:hypothetical protein FS749_003671 [Ceratobasidium sp. UAMH 11750]|nr:hypothetical protein FS749_003671 [Ceratobasidium sp. UAMH 11750]